MKTSEAKTFIEKMVTEGKLSYSKEQGLLLTEKAVGTPLESIAELSAEQVSRIGETYNSLFETKKRVSSLLKNGVTADTLRTLLAEIEGKPLLEVPTDGANNNGQLLLSGEENQPGTVVTGEPERQPAADTPEASGENSADDNIREGVNRGNRRSAPNRSSVGQPGGTL